MNIEKMNKIVLLGATAIVLSIVPFGSAFAQAGNGCSCLVPAATTGEIVSASGDVEVSQANGFAPGQPGTVLQSGTQIIVGPGSEVVMTLGPQCRLQIPQNNDVTLDPQNESICVRQEAADGQAANETGGQTTLTNTIAAFGAGAAVLGPFVGLAVSNSDPVSD